MIKVEKVIQDGIKDCGVCSLLSIIRYYGGDVPKEYLREITYTTEQGVTAYNLLEAGSKLGFATEALEGDVLDIDNRFLPCVAHVIINEKYKHFVVIYKIDKKRNSIIIMDPSKGEVKMTVDDFKRITTNNYLFFIPNKKIPTISNDNKILNILKDFININKKILLLIIIISILYTITNIFTSYNLQFIIEKAISTYSLNNLYTLMIIFIPIYFSKEMLDYFRNYLLNFIAHKLDYSLISTSFSHILLLPHLYYKNHTSGEIMTRISDLEEIRDTVSNLIVTFFVDFILLIFVLIFLLSLSVKLTTIIIIAIIIYSIFTIIYNKIIYSILKKSKENEAEVNSYMLELINGINTIKGNNIYNKVFNIFFKKYNYYLNNNYKLGKYINIYSLISSLCISIIMITINYYGGYLVINNELTIAKLITYNSLIYYFLTPVKNIINFDIAFRKIKIIIERINELLNVEEENLLLDDNLLSSIDGNIEINNLSYSYNRKQILKNISLKISKGEKIVICGKSGSGKSTLAKLLSRYIQVERNKIKIDKIDINDYNLDTIRNNITYISQNELIFNDTVYNNININKTRDPTEIYNICKYTKVDEIVNNRNLGYKMILDENGCNISGGERQRIILARTFSKKSSVYILDESFSEIDSFKEREILKSIFNENYDKTIIVISHRNDNNDLFDRIINMEELTNGYKRV